MNNDIIWEFQVDLTGVFRGIKLEFEKGYMVV